MSCNEQQVAIRLHDRSYIDVLKKERAQWMQIDRQWKSDLKDRIVIK